MSESKKALGELISSLKQARDEARVKAHLAQSEAKDEYERLSHRVDELLAQYEPVRDASSETAQNVFAALKLAAEELSHGFKKIRKSM